MHISMSGLSRVICYLVLCASAQAGYIVTTISGENKITGQFMAGQSDADTAHQNQMFVGVVIDGGPNNIIQGLGLSAVVTRSTQPMAANIQLTIRGRLGVSPGEASYGISGSRHYDYMDLDSTMWCTREPFAGDPTLWSNQASIFVNISPMYIESTSLVYTEFEDIHFPGEISFTYRCNAWGYLISSESDAPDADGGETLLFADVPTPGSAALMLACGATIVPRRGMRRHQS